MIGFFVITILKDINLFQIFLSRNIIIRIINPANVEFIKG